MTKENELRLLLMSRDLADLQAREAEGRTEAAHLYYGAAMICQQKAIALFAELAEQEPPAFEPDWESENINAVLAALMVHFDAQADMAERAGMAETAAKYRKAAADGRRALGVEG